MRLVEALKQRRRELRKRLPGRQVLLAAGGLVPRNYPANNYPFRASSHFLFLFGKPLPGAFGLLTENATILFCDRQRPEDRIWEGLAPDWSELGETLGVDEIRPLEELAHFAAVSSVLALPVQEPQANAELALILGRTPDISGEDRPLALALVDLRLSHDEWGVAQLRIAADASAAAHIRAMQAAVPGKTEREVLAELEYETAIRGMTAAFPAIVSTECETLHVSPTDRAIEEGSLLLVDFGVETPFGYASDITRTHCVGRELSGEQRAIYQLVLAAQQAALDAAKSGVRWLDVHRAAASVICAGLVDLGLLVGNASELTARGAHTLFFPHGIGHLVGLDVHDMEDLGDLAGYPDGRARSLDFGLKSLRLDRELKPGMAVTIEPGIYFNEFLLEEPELSSLWRGAVNRSAFQRFKPVRGVRIEDTVLISDSGVEILTAAAPKLGTGA